MMLIRVGKNNKLNFLWLKMARLGPPFWHPKSPRKSLCGSLFCITSQEMRRMSFFLGAQNGVFWVGVKKFVLKIFMCFFGPLVEKMQKGSISRHGLLGSVWYPPQRAPERCPTNGVWRILQECVSRHSLLDTVKKHPESTTSSTLPTHNKLATRSELLSLHRSPPVAKIP